MGDFVKETIIERSRRLKRAKQQRGTRFRRTA